MESTTKKSGLPIAAGIFMVIYLIGSITQIVVSWLLSRTTIVPVSFGVRSWLVVGATIAMIIFLFMQKKGIPMVIIQGIFCLNSLLGLVSTVSALINYNNNLINNATPDLSPILQYGAALTGSLMALAPFVLILVLSIISVKTDNVGAFGKVAYILVIILLIASRFSSIFTVASYAIVGQYALFGTSLLGWFNGILLDVALILTCKWLATPSSVNQVSEEAVIEKIDSAVDVAMESIDSAEEIAENS